MHLAGKTTLITGASSGIGASFAHLLGEKQSNLVLVARSLNKLEDIAQTLKDKHGIKVQVYSKDLSVPGAAQELYDQVQKDGLSIDLLINNAGFGKWGDFKEFSLRTYHDMVQLNVTALTDLCYLFLEDLKQRPEAGIINVGSTASFIPVPYSSVYAATKSYVLFFTEGLVGELAGTNVKVHCLCPGGTATNFNTVASDSKHPNTEDMKSPDEVAKEGLDAFLAGKHYVVTGRQFFIRAMKFLSRKRVVDMVANFWKKRLGKA